MVTVIFRPANAIYQSVKIPGMQKNSIDVEKNLIRELTQINTL